MVSKNHSIETRILYENKENIRVIQTEFKNLKSSLEKLVDSVDNLAVEVTSIKTRMAFYIGGASVLVFALEKIISF